MISASQKSVDSNDSSNGLAGSSSTFTDNIFDQGLPTNYDVNTRAIPVVLERDDPLRSIIEAEEDLYSIEDIKARYE